MMFNSSPSSDSSSPPRRASLMLWLLGALGLFSGFCCVSGMIELALLPVEKVTELMPSFTSEQVMEVKRAAVPAVAATLLLWMLPALAYLVLGFGVRAARPRSIRIARILTLIHTLMLGGIILLGVPAALITGNIPSILVNLLLFGALGALTYATFRQLGRARSTATTVDPDAANDPWSHEDSGNSN